MIGFIKNWFNNLHEDYVIKRYTKIGLMYGDALSYSFMGKCIGFDDLEKTFQKWEKEYERLGYEKISIQDWKLAGGYHGPNFLIGKFRERRKTSTDSEC